MVFVKRFAAVLSVAVLAAWPGAPVQAQAPDLILHNGKVVTVDPAFSVAEGVAIRGIASSRSERTTRCAAWPRPRRG